MSDVDPTVAGLVGVLTEAAQRAGMSVGQLADLVTGNPARPVPVLAMPTVAQYLPVVRAAATPGTVPTYETYWMRLVAELGDARVDQVRTSDLRALANRIRADAIRRRNYRQGLGTLDNSISAFRCFFRHAVDDRLIADNPAAALAKPRRPRSNRRALSPDEQRQLIWISSTTGNDPDLDTLLVRYHLETGARRGGALALRVRDIDRDRCMVLLREKGCTERWQPITPVMAEALLGHIRDRCDDDPDAAAFRYAGGEPLTRRRYNSLVERWRKHLPWVARENVSIHWLRHTAITTVERTSGFAVAQLFAGHTGGPITTTYVKASAMELANALVLITGEPHPLATRDPAPPRGQA